MPALRGGGADKSSKLLDGLTKLLARFERDGEEDGFDNDDTDQALLLELQRLISRRPWNLPQKLKSLVRNFTVCKQNPSLPGRVIGLRLFVAIPSQTLKRKFLSSIRNCQGG